MHTEATAMYGLIFAPCCPRQHGSLLLATTSLSLILFTPQRRRSNEHGMVTALTALEKQREKDRKKQACHMHSPTTMPIPTITTTSSFCIRLPHPAVCSWQPAQPDVLLATACTLYKRPTVCEHDLPALVTIGHVGTGVHDLEQS
jgi:hypothetical protein